MAGLLILLSLNPLRDGLVGRFGGTDHICVTHAQAVQKQGHVARNFIVVLMPQNDSSPTDFGLLE